MIRLPPKVIAATTLVAIAPAAVVWALRAAGVLDSFILCAALGAVLSLAACQLAAALWERRPGSGDVLLSDLMIWGWIRRCLVQRRLADATSTLGLRRTGGTCDPMKLTVERRAGMLERLAADLEHRDPYTHGHSKRVARYSSMVAKRMGVDAAELARIRTAAAVHDVGKLNTPTAVLHKPGQLTDEEFELIKRHAAVGAAMVGILEDEQLRAIVRHHHERLDGTGYPDGLAGTEIPLGARIIAVADTFDAITSARAYRDAKPHRRALEILKSEAGTQLDRDAVNAFCSVYVGRRPLSVWVAFTDLAERAIAWLAPDALGSTARVVALAATTAAVGGGAVATSFGSPVRSTAPTAQPAAAAPTGQAHGRLATSSALTSPAGTLASAPRQLIQSSSARVPSTKLTGKASGIVPVTIGTPPTTGTPAPRGNGPAPAGSPPAPGGTPSVSGKPSVNGGSGPAGVTSVTLPAAGAGTTTGPGVTVTGAGPGTGTGSGSSPGVQVNAGSSSGPSVGVSAGTGSSGTNIGVSAGTGGSGPSVSAGVTLGGSGSGSGTSGSGTSGSGTSSSGDTQSQAPSVSVTTPSGSGSGVGAQVNVPGVISVKLHVG